MVFDDEDVTLSDGSDFSDSDGEQNEDKMKITYRDLIAKNLVNSLDKVDKRMLKLHRVVRKHTGVKESLFRMLSMKRMLKAIPSDSVSEVDLSIE